MLILKRKLFTLNNAYTVQDENGNTVFAAKGRFLSPGRHVHIYDTDGNEVAYIKKCLLGFPAEFHIYQAGQLVSKIKRKLALDRHLLLIYSQLFNGMAEGGFWTKKFTIYDGPDPIAVTRKMLSFGHTYKVEMGAGWNPAFIIAHAIVIDMVFQKSIR